MGMGKKWRETLVSAAEELLIQSIRKALVTERMTGGAGDTAGKASAQR